MIEHFKTLLTVLAAIAGFMFSFGLNLKFLKLIDYLTGAVKHRNTIVIRSFAYLVFYYVMTSFILPKLSGPGAAPSAVQIGSKKVESESPEPLDADEENIPGENSKAKD